MCGLSWLGGIFIGAILGSLLEGVLTYILEKRGIYDFVARWLVWPPYYRDSRILKEAVQNCDNKFLLITGDGDFLDKAWGADILRELKKKTRNTEVRILFTGDPALPDIRQRVCRLVREGLSIHVMERGPLACQLRAIFSLNTMEYSCIRTELPRRHGEYIVRKLGERDLRKLIEGYFEITPMVRECEEEAHKIDLILDEGT